MYMNPTNNQQAMGLQVFYNEDTNVNIRIEKVNGEPWFVAKDICNALELSDVSMTVKRLDDDEKLIQTTLASGQGREMWFVNESGLYSLIFQSRKPEAKAFRKWVTNVVLPSIRRTGLYSSASRPTSNRLPLPKYRPYFDKWKDNVSPYVSRRELDAVAYALDVSLCHVRKVYAGTSMSENVARYITLAAKKNRREGRVYQKAVPVYEQLSIEWNEELDAKGNVKAVIKEPTATL